MTTTNHVKNVLYSLVGCVAQPFMAKVPPLSFVLGPYFMLSHHPTKWILSNFVVNFHDFGVNHRQSKDTRHVYDTLVISTSLTFGPIYEIHVFCTKYKWSYPFHLPLTFQYLFHNRMFFNMIWWRSKTIIHLPILWMQSKTHTLEPRFAYHYNSREGVYSILHYTSRFRDIHMD